MELFNRLSGVQKALLSAGLPSAGFLIFLFSSWETLQTGLAENEGSITGVLWLAVLLCAAGVYVAFMGSTTQVNHEEERLKKSLEVCQANVMVADNDFNICYMNESVKQMMRNNDEKLREAIPGFDSNDLLGRNVDGFHKNPSHQRSLVSGLREVYRTDLTLNGMTFGLVATPLFSDEGNRLGTVVEWYDRTEELKKQEEEKQIASENARIAQALKICDTNVMMADENLNIIYMNDSVKEMLEDAESELKKELPNFDSRKLMGASIDTFHANPSHQRRLLEALTQPYRTNIQVGSLHFGLIATPVMDNDGHRLGTVVEWENKTEALKLQDEQRRVSEENLRVRQALDNVTTNAMIADGDGNIVYMNKSVSEMLQRAEHDIQKELAHFDAKKVVGTNFDVFHKNPAHQRNLLSKLTSTYSAQIEVGGRTFALVANPVVNDDGDRIGSVVEWADRTEEVQTEQEIDHLVSQASNGELSVRVDVSNKQGFMLNLSTRLNALMDVTEEVIVDTMRVLDALAHGNLQEKIHREYQGSFGKLKNDANSTVEKLISIIGGISESANAVSSGADEIAQGNTDLSQRTEEQASSLEETASSMEQMTSVVKQSSENAQQANDLATEAWRIAEKGGNVVSRAVTAMDEINTSSKKIADIISVIDEIAFQTNLLALNAAVEAARAGEQGRGFAVVAGEVRNLAQRSAGAAKEIKDLIRDSVSKVDDGTALVNESGETLQGIVDSVQKVSQMIGDITSAAMEQTSGIEQVNTAIAQMDEMTQQNAALVEEASAAGEALSGQARQLMSLIDFFTLDRVAHAQVAASQPAAPAMAHLGDSNGNTSGNANRIKTPIHSDDEWEEF